MVGSLWNISCDSSWGKQSSLCSFISVLKELCDYIYQLREPRVLDIYTVASRAHDDIIISAAIMMMSSFTLEWLAKMVKLPWPSMSAGKSCDHCRTDFDCTVKTLHFQFLKTNCVFSNCVYITQHIKYNMYCVLFFVYSKQIYYRNRNLPMVVCPNFEYYISLPTIRRH